MSLYWCGWNNAVEEIYEEDSAFSLSTVVHSAPSNTHSPAVRSRDSYGWEFLNVKKRKKVREILLGLPLLQGAEPRIIVEILSFVAYPDLSNYNHLLVIEDFTTRSYPPALVPKDTILEIHQFDGDGMILVDCYLFTHAQWLSEREYIHVKGIEDVFTPKVLGGNHQSSANEKPDHLSPSGPSEAETPQKTAEKLKTPEPIFVEQISGELILGDTIDMPIQMDSDGEFVSLFSTPIEAPSFDHFLPSLSSPKPSTPPQRPSEPQKSVPVVRPTSTHPKREIPLS